MQHQIEDLLASCLDSEEYADCFVIDVRCTPKGQISVYLDADSGITLERCKSISRKLEKKIDEAGVFGGSYALEVSSPGTDRPLTQRRQYGQHQGRKLKVALEDGSEIEGTFSRLCDDSICLSIANGKQLEEREISFENIKESFVQISFKK